VLVRETEDGEVVIEHKGVALPARAFEKDARVRQGAIVDNKVSPPRSPTFNVSSGSATR
jgi:hypothetical protein